MASVDEGKADYVTTAGGVPASTIPTWMCRDLLAWITAAFSEQYFDETGVRRVRWSRTLLENAERSLKLELDWDDPEEDLLARSAADETICLRVIDHSLAHHSLPAEMALRLNDLLTTSESPWRVASEGDSLTRLPSSHLDEMTRAGGRPGTHLNRASRALYGGDVKPGEAYRESVKALEAALKPVVTPRDPTPTLGKMIPAIKQSKHPFELALGPQSRHAAGLLTQLLEAVWRGQIDRHGNDDPQSLVEVDVGAAHTAFTVAVAVVHLVEEGLFWREAEAT